ncbi:LysE family translocator [Nesterenkonia aerolata]|uniref:LysE family translocator n=1 Tax=Nesterenkonia aerolata TaxID=3074079 RepID=A0ABU2DT02_9MICC|nr:LysE family translocator [Nesterenkonia sp. LY-0111]MDR8019637.1 LysE family translocator [Nesterenkonia sp. LY-0111]
MTLLSLVLFVFATAGTPGPNNTIAMASGATFGLRRTIPTIAGVNIGFPTMIILVGIGLGQVLEQWPVILDVLRPIGIIYLLYLAWKIATGPTDLAAQRQGSPPGFVQMALFQFVNPKAWTMVVGVIAAYTGAWESFVLEILVIALVYAVFGTPCTTVWALLGVGVGRVLSRPAHLRIFNLVMAGLLVVSLIPAVVQTVEWALPLLR